MDMTHKFVQYFSLLEDKAEKGSHTLLGLGVEEVMFEDDIIKVFKRDYFIT